MNINIEDFIPFYPSIDSKDFYMDIYSKKEFYDIKVPIYEKINQEKRDLLTQQKIITRFLSPKTEYDELLIYHDMGCLDPDTLVRMYDNTLKKASQVKVDDLLLGDDFTPRRVLKLYSGISGMYEVSQTNGMTYKINEKHVLTLIDKDENINDMDLYQYILRNDKNNLYGYRILLENDIIPSKINIKYVGIGEYNGWLIDGNHRFLLQDYTVTHNSGKSCAAIGAIENAKKEGGFKKALIVAPGPGLLDNFVQEIILKCTDSYITSELKSIRTDSDKMRKMRHIAKKNGYSFLTYGGLAKELQKLRISKKDDEESNKNIIKYFSNMYIVMDEIHHLRPQNAKKEDITNYNEILNMCKWIKNSKILLMSGTVMRDGPEEIASIFNLLNRNVQLPIDQKFINKFMEIDENGILNVKKQMIPILKNVFRGRVSYLSSLQSDITKKYIGLTGKDIPCETELKFFIVDIDIMSKFQTDTYNSTIKDISDKQNFELDSRQVCLFCYPPISPNEEVGLYGKKGFDAYIVKNENKTYKLKDNLKKLLLGSNNDETIKNISKYSSKYAKTLKQIIEAKDKCIFVYCDSVQGSGAILFSLLLELLGFKRSFGEETEEGLRYGILTDITLKSNFEITRIKNRFNNPDNMLGKYIKVIIGSTIVTEGFSLYNVQEEHILTPHWNYTPITQALSRGLRYGSHEQLIKSGIKPVMNIYQHVSLTNKNKSTIELKMYELSEQKDISIKKIDRVLKESAFDCGLTYERNKSNAKINGTRECEYELCDYKCDGIIFNDGYPINLDKLDYLTYNIYYSEEQVNIVSKKLEIIFRDFFTLSYNDIKSLFKDSLKDFELISSLRNIINNNVPIRNKYGFLNYLKEDNDIYFLVDNLNNDNNYLSSFYNKNIGIVLDTSKTFKKELNNIMINSIIEIIEIINYTDDKKIFEKYIKKLPLNIQEEYIESVLISKLSNSTINIDLQNNVLDYFKPFITKTNSDILYISSLLLNDFDKLRCLQKNVDLVWNDCDLETTDKFKQKNFESKDIFLDKNTYGYYGIDINDDSNRIDDFKIRDITNLDEETKKSDKRTIKQGMKCKSGWKKSKLISMILIFKLDFPNEFLSNMSKSDILEYMKSKIKINNTIKDIPENELLKYNINDLKRISYWSDKGQDDICKGIKEWFINKNLLKLDTS